MPQRTWQIWSFAFLFFMRYWLLGRKWSYGRKGMTEQRVKERKSKLAVWLREGLVKLGPTFIKVLPGALHTAISDTHTARLVPVHLHRVECGLLTFRRGHADWTAVLYACGCAEPGVRQTA